MIPINNSDLAWLIVSDFNQDHDILGVEDLREDILNPEINQWRFEYPSSSIGGISEGGYVGSYSVDRSAVGNNQCWQVGSRFDPDIGVYPSHLVGGIPAVPSNP